MKQRSTYDLLEKMEELERRSDSVPTHLVMRHAADLIAMVPAYQLIDYDGIRLAPSMLNGLPIVEDPLMPKGEYELRFRDGRKERFRL